MENVQPTNDANWPIRDFVLPVMAIAAPTPAQAAARQVSTTGLVGTGFLIENNKFLVTAAHVALQPGLMAASYVDPYGNWITIDLSSPKFHPEEDLAIFRAGDSPLRPSPLKLSFTREHSGGEYSIFGYPDEVLFEDPRPHASGRVLMRPDLVYSAGHIRRSCSFELPSIRGRSFYELSDVAGAGCSGAPMNVQHRGLWTVSGIYLAERQIEQGGRPSRERGYALRLIDCEDWVISVLSAG